MDNRRPTWAEIDLGAIKHNIASVRKAINPAMIMAVVKADGYGHGMLEVSQVCLEQGVEWLGVASLDEAVYLRESGISASILVLGYIPDEFAETVIENDIRATVFTSAFAREISRAAVKLERTANLHIKIDTGMGRLGFAPDLNSVDMVSEICSMPGIRAEGIFTHFAEADSADKSFTREQIHLFTKFLTVLEQRGISIPLKHCSNSAALMELPEAHFNMVRAGIVIYGLYPSDEVDKQNLELIPAMSLRSRISFLKTLEGGHSVSYGRTYFCQDSTRVATVPIGYADGYSRLLSNRAQAIIRGQKVPLIGTICMDQCMFDVSRIEEVSEGDEVILFGRPEDGVTAEDLAEIIDTINYEILCSVSARVPRLYIK